MVKNAYFYFYITYYKKSTTKMVNLTECIIPFNMESQTDSSNVITVNAHVKEWSVEDMIKPYYNVTSNRKKVLYLKKTLSFLELTDDDMLSEVSEFLTNMVKNGQI